MASQLIKDHSGNPVSVLVDYQQWLGIEQILMRESRQIDAPENPLDWYTLTETTNSILNELLAYTSRERRKELRNTQPDTEKLDALRKLFEEVHAINKNPDNFRNASGMQAIIDRYAPFVKSLYETR